MSESKSRSLAVQFSGFLHKQEKKIAAALPAHIPVGQMLSATMTCFNASKELQRCAESEEGRMSIVQSVFVGATVGLVPGVLGQAYLIPYQNSRLPGKPYICTFVPGWKGIISVIGRSGRGLVRSGAVFEGDDFDWDTGTGMFVKHKSLAKTRDPKKITHVYAIGEIAGMQDRIIEVWDIDRVYEHFNQYNKVGERHYAHKNWEMYARKIPVLQVAKYVPQTTEVINVVAAAYTAERNENLIVDEHGVPQNADFVDDAQPARKAPIRQPERKAAAAPADEPKKGKGGAAEPASEGQKAWLKTKAKDSPTLTAAMRRAGLKRADWETLTVDGFNAIKEELK